jgi:4-hydroxy-4-methyl-2-oxoglutarate aldolase
VCEFISQHLLDQLRSFDSPTVSNAIEALAIRDRTQGYASMELRCQFPELKPMVGYAVTCTADSTSPGTPQRNKWNELFDLVASRPKPAVVVIQNCGPDRLRSCFVGDMSALAYQKLGAVGLATDGGFRDLSGIRRGAPGFQLFSPGAVVSHGNAAIVEVDIPVSLAGLTIQPGDLLHGDESGLLNVPTPFVQAIIVQAALVRRTEQEWADYAHSDLFKIEGMKERLLR